MQKLIVAGIVLVAAIVVVRRLYRTFSRSGQAECGCSGCSQCSVQSECTIRSSVDQEQGSD
ncbi:FeoB-associated Cys-rich membrane protein [Desulfovermiculus halophilus]|jgi:hypothetical protein|uniref:FeoB-associated Cys-rich membrane protein n=1 Tax=Desulfovermiculus halophilus TaxID=339722 RepID=UPI000A02F6EB|nr:FeoB-associated Cys-rich membrane protein [Desulfovermiculus halophilus]